MPTGVREIVGASGREVGASVTDHRNWHARCTLPPPLLAAWSIPDVLENHDAR